MFNPLSAIRAFFVEHTRASVAEAEAAVKAFESHVTDEIKAAEGRLADRLTAVEAKLGITPPAPPSPPAAA